jgi:hypothetical protein
MDEVIDTLIFTENEKIKNILQIYFNKNISEIILKYNKIIYVQSDWDELVYVPLFF